MLMTPRVVDIYHGDLVGGRGPAAAGFEAAKKDGIWGVIHKASEGAGYKDTRYTYRRRAAESVGLLWGAYHFNNGANVARQVDWFMRCADPSDKTLMVLDYEDNRRSNMSPGQMVEFLHRLEEKLGRKGVIYSGNRMKETVRRLGRADKLYVTSHKLWLCQYGPRARLPAGWKEYWLWQYTGDGIGFRPHYVNGITVPGGRGIDLNVYNGTKAQLAKEWAS